MNLAMNYNQRHNYYVKRTQDWLASHGFITQKVETNFSITVGDRQVYTKRDFWGADIAYRTDTCLGFIQLKTGANQVAGGAKQLTQDTAWPPDIGRYVVWWDKGTKIINGPNVAQVTDHYGPDYCSCHLPQEPVRYYTCNIEGPGCKRWTS